MSLWNNRLQFLLCAVFAACAGCSVDMGSNAPRQNSAADDATAQIGDAPVEWQRGWSRMNRVMVSMRDGVRLDTHIWIPEGPGRFPALLHRTPYGIPSGHVGRHELDGGTALVFQNVRGTHASQGEAFAFGADGWGKLQDGYDTVEWLARQPWCNGTITTAGESAPGITQYQLAGSAPPHYAGGTVGIACSDPYSQAVFQGGVFREELVRNWLITYKFDWNRHADVFTKHPAYDAFWKTLNLNERETAARVRVPMFHVGGWWDIFSQGTIDAFVSLQHGGAEGARGRQRLVMGPNPHVLGNTGDYHFHPNVNDPPLQEVLLSGSSVLYYTVGAMDEPGAPGNEWRRATDWPPAPSVPAPVYFTVDGGMALQPPAGEARRGYDYDPKNPVPTRGGANLHIDMGPFDQRPVEGRKDVLLFTSPPLARPVEITGRVTVKLRVSTSAKDTDFTAKFTDVYPDGRSILFLDGIRRLRFREGYEQEVFAEAGKVYPLEIDLWTTSVVLNKGHRIRIAVSSSNSPRFRPNLNTGGPPLEEGEGIVAHNAVHVGADAASGVVLPVVGEPPAFQ